LAEGGLPGGWQGLQQRHQLGNGGLAIACGPLAGGEIVGDYAYAERRRESLAAFCGVYPWEIQIKKR
jgi:hypothetical protein